MLRSIVTDLFDRCSVHLSDQIFTFFVPNKAQVKIIRFSNSLSHMNQQISKHPTLSLKPLPQHCPTGFPHSFKSQNFSSWKEWSPDCLEHALRHSNWCSTPTRHGGHTQGQKTLDCHCHWARFDSVHGRILACAPQLTWMKHSRMPASFKRTFAFAFVWSTNPWLTKGTCLTYPAWSFKLFSLQQSLGHVTTQGMTKHDCRPGCSQAHCLWRCVSQYVHRSTRTKFEIRVTFMWAFFNLKGNDLRDANGLTYPHV